MCDTSSQFPSSNYVWGRSLVLLCSWMCESVPVYPLFFALLHLVVDAKYDGDLLATLVKSFFMLSVGGDVVPIGTGVHGLRPSRNFAILE